VDELAPREDETLDVLSRTLRILQRRRGHRATSDDTLLAWAAAEAAPSARRVLELGCGKGTVGLLLARCLPAAHIIGVEALPESVDLAQRNRRLNGVEAQYEVRLGDLRDPDVLRGEAPFELVCGAPPFMAVGAGVLPQDPQRAAGRFELRGGVEGYLETAARHLGADGQVVILMDGVGGERAAVGGRALGLAVRRRLTVHPRPGRPATYEILTFARSSGPTTDGSLIMRGAEGPAWSAAFISLRARLDLP
jgi:tRNA1Val (adenine37-N6)-methyltransferase